MAFTEKELQISNKSYTNKDFEAIYTELITFAENLSKRYSPMDSNESDPFIVLLKLAAFVADKVNYNLDKNILERFILSCTQETSMQDITSRLGYRMHYYIASATDVIFRYAFPDGSTINSVYIPRFSILSDGDSIQYVTVLPATIDRISNESVPVKALQGKVKTVEILGNNVVKLENLNANNVLYFSERRVAENGVFINIDKGEEWVRSDNLHSELYGSRVYKFGFDSIRNLPYLEFPEWISTIIDDGLVIQYIVTDGEQGNVSSRALKTITRTISDDVGDSEIGVYNLSAADTGKNPETLDESYQGFKKIIGTFDTLVTCRDYANKIYQFIDNLTDDPIVSNVQVGDRRKDINYSCDVITLGEDCSPIVKSIPIKNQSGTADILTPFDLEIYPLRPFSAVKKDGYVDSYRLLPNIAPIENALEKTKTICHDLHTLDREDSTSIGAIEIEYKLTAVISTIKKVNSVEQQDILNKVNIALMNAYNPRQLEFGYEIPYESLVDTIQKADERIKIVMLQEPEQSATIMTAALSNAGATSGLPIQYDYNQTSTDQFKAIVAKNVLGGNIALFQYDDSFEYDYSQLAPIKYNNVKYISTSANLPMFDSEDVASCTYTLQPNEVIQFLGPQFVTEITYPYGINYHLHLTNDTYIPKNSCYTFKNADDYLVLTYEDNNGNTIIRKYSIDSNRVISPNFDLYDTAKYQEEHETLRPTLNGITNSEYPQEFSNTPFFTLSTKNEIAIQRTVTTILNVLSKCYWIIDFKRSPWRYEDGGYVHFDQNPPLTDECQIVLDDGDYFFYSDINLTSLFAYGSGTKIVTTVETAAKMNTPLEEVKIEEINIQGLKALKSIFVDIALNNSSALRIHENEIITLTAKDTVKIDFTEEATLEIQDNIFTPVDQSKAKITINYANESDSVQLSDRSNLSPEYQWSARALLDINAGPGQPQTLTGNQRVTILAYQDPETGYAINGLPPIPDFIAGRTFTLDILTQLGGGDYIDLEYMNFAQERVCPTILAYSIQESNNTPAVTKISNDFYQVNFTEQASGYKSNNMTVQEVTENKNEVSKDPTTNTFPLDGVTYLQKNDVDKTFTIVSVDPGVNPSEEGYYTLLKANSMSRYFTIHVAGLETGDELYIHILNSSDQPIQIGTNGVNVLIGTLDGNKLTANGLYVFQISGNIATKMYFELATVASTHTVDDIKLHIGDLKEVMGINPLLGLKENDEDFLQYLKDHFAPQFEQFYLTNTIENSRRIEVSNEFKLNSPQAFYDQNNIANKWTIPKIDFKNSNINIAYSSKL